MNRRLKIAQIAPLVESVPPQKYGGTERVISVLTEELVRRGHDVTLFASGDSVTSARLRSVYPRSLRSAGVTDDRQKNGLSFLNIGLAYEHADDFDIIHDHCGVFSLPTANVCSTPVVCTLHGAFFPHNKKLFQELSNPYFVPISDNQSQSVVNLHTLGTIYNGLPLEHYPFSLKRENFLLYVGRITALKGTHFAVQVAHRLKMPLILAAKLEPSEQAYFDTEVKPYLNDDIRWIGEVTEEERNQLMSKAHCFLHPGTWQEPFGLTLIEAMACGAPVIAFNKGSIPEIIEQGKTGFIVKNLADMVKAVKKVNTIDRSYCRNYALEHFSSQKMVDEYEKLYEKVLSIEAVKKAMDLQPRSGFLTFTTSTGLSRVAFAT